MPRLFYLPLVQPGVLLSLKAATKSRRVPDTRLLPLYMRLLLFAYQPINGYAEHIAQCDKLCIRNIPQLALQL